MKNTLPLKITALAGMSLMPFPLAVAAQVAENARFNARNAALLFLAGGVAVLFGMVLDLPELKKAVLCRAYFVLSRLIAVSSGLTAAVFIPWKTGYLQLAAAVLTLSYCCFLGLKNRKSAFTEIFSTLMLRFYTLVSIAALFFCERYAPEAKSAHGAIITVFVAEYAIAAVLLGQTNIENQINRRLDIRALIPKNLRLFNLSLILLIGAAFALVYLFRDLIKGAATAVASFAVNTVVSVLSRITYTRVNPGASGAVPDAYAAAPKDLHFIGVIFTVILTAMAVFALFKISYAVYDALKLLFRWIAGLFKPRKRVIRQTAAYEDFYENVTFEKEKKRGKRALKDCLRLYKHESDPASKIRLSYKIYLLRQIRSGVKTDPSLTAEETLGESRKDYCAAYCGVRYGLDTGEESLRLADEIVGEPNSHSHSFHTSGQ